MSLIEIRKRSLNVETISHEGDPVAAQPLRLAAPCAVIRNPYAGRYEPDLLPFMAELRSLGTLLAEELVATLGKENVEVYSKAAIVGVDGEMEHGAVWHEARGWAMRAVLGEPKAMVPAAKAVVATGYRLMVPLHNIHASYVRVTTTAWRLASRMHHGRKRFFSLWSWVPADGSTHVLAA